MGAKWEYLSFEVLKSKSLVVSVQGVTDLSDENPSKASFGGLLLKTDVYVALNIAGDEGWELVSVVSHERQGSTYDTYIFKKPVE